MAIAIVNHLPTVRHQRNWRLIPLADATGLSVGFLSRLEHDQTAPRVTHVARLAEVLECGPWELFSYDGYPCPCCCHRQGDPGGTP